MRMRNPRAGQSIIEVLVATAVGSLMIVAAVGLISPALRANTEVAKVQIGAAIAKETIEQVRSWAGSDWHNVANLSTSSANVYYLVPGQTFIVATGTENVSIGGPTTGLVGYWKLDETSGTRFLDSSGNGYHGTSTGGPTVTSTCHVGSCLTFDGSNDYVEISSPWTFTGRYAISAWIRTTSTAEKPIVSNRSGSGDVTFGIWNGVAYIHENDCTPTSATSTKALNDNQFHHLLFVRNGSTSAIYVDGALDRIQPVLFCEDDTGDSLRIGHDVTNFSQFFRGQIDEVRVYDRKLTAEEAEEIYRAGLFRRNFYLEHVNRDGSDNIVSGAGTYDPSTLKVTVNYSWPNGATSSLVSYITRAANKLYEQTDWFNGAGEDGPVTSTNGKFATSSNMDWLTVPGSIQIDLP